MLRSGRYSSRFSKSIMKIMLRDVVHPIRLSCFDVSVSVRDRGLLVSPRISSDGDRSSRRLEIGSARFSACRADQLRDPMGNPQDEAHIVKITRRAGRVHADYGMAQLARYRSHPALGRRSCPESTRFAFLDSRSERHPCAICLQAAATEHRRRAIDSPDPEPVRSGLSSRVWRAAARRPRPGVEGPGSFWPCGSPQKQGGGEARRGRDGGQQGRPPGGLARRA